MTSVAVVGGYGGSGRFRRIIGVRSAGSARPGVEWSHYRREGTWRPHRAGRRCSRQCRGDYFAWRRRRRGCWTTRWPWCSSARCGRSCTTSSIRCSPARSLASLARLSAPAAGMPRTGWLLAPSRSTSSWARGLTRSRGGARTCSAPSGCSRLITLPPRPGSWSGSGPRASAQ